MFQVQKLLVIALILSLMVVAVVLASENMESFAGGLTPEGYLPLILQPENTPTPTITNTPVPSTAVPTQTPQPSVTPVIPPANCQTCDYNAYNCSDFDYQFQAQACFLYCLQQVGYDVHDLDRDGDGIACENLPNP